MPRKPRNSPNPPGRPPRVTCKRCGAAGRRNEELSQRGLCDGCSTSAMVQQVIEVRQKRGPRYEKWRAGVLRWVMDDLVSDQVFDHDRDSLPTI